jgi:starch-binding outer membrane protein, SusD/RagB family
MKNKLKWILIQLVVILLLGACTDSFFNEIPSDRTTPDKNFKSLLDAELACIAPLAILRDVAPQMVFASDLLSDMTVLTENADLNWQEINNHTMTANNPYIDASDLYKVIINANESLLHIDSILNVDQDITEIDVKVLKGNLIGIRSWAYFTIARLYGEVAYIKDNLPKMPENLVYIPREAMLDTLVNNLLPYLDIDYQDYLNLSMYNKALIGEIYLEKQDYNNAVTYLLMAIEGFENDPALYKINKAYQKDSWKKIFIDAESNISEVMIAVPFDYINNQINPIELWYGYNDQYVAKPTDFIVNLFNTQINIRGKLTGDIYRGLGTSYDTISGNNYVKKYHLEAVPLGSDIILYRAADIHLLLAEAMNRSGNSQAALKILNDGYVERTGWANSIGIRKRAYLSNYSIDNIPAGVDAVNYIEDLIVQERAMELAFEGKRWTDLMRVARRRGASYLADKVASKYSDPNMANSVREKLMNETNWYLPFHK